MTPAGAQGAPILLLEDDRPTGRLAAHVLAAAGIANPVNWVQWGTDAIAFLDRAASDPELVPVLCVLDLALPDISGLSVLAHIRRTPATRDVPVIMLTGSGRDADIEAAYHLGISAYLVKPAGIHGLADVVGELGLRYTLLRGQGQRPQPEADLTAESPLSATAVLNPTGEQSEPQSPLLDPVKVASLHRLAGNPAVGPRRLREVLTSFRHDATEGVLAVHRAVAARDLAEIAELAHRLAGSAGITGAEVLCVICAELQDRARQGYSEELAQLSYRLDGLLERTWSALEREFATELQE